MVNIKNLEYKLNYGELLGFFLKISVFTMVFVSHCLLANDIEPDKNPLKIKEAKQTRNKALKIQHAYPDSAIILFKKSYSTYLNIHDTINAVNCLLDIANVYQNKADYAKAYDAYWNALIKADNLKDYNTNSVIYDRLGKIYSYYGRERESLKYHKKALETQKTLLKNGEIEPSGLAPYYYSMVSTYRGLNKIKKAKAYLDSCYMFYSEKNELTPKEYFDVEKAWILYREGMHDEALEMLDETAVWFNKNNPSYLVLIYKFYGDVYLEKGVLKKSKEFYDQSLQISKSYNAHIDFTPLVFEKLTTLSLLENDYQSAYLNIKRAKDLDQKFFDVRSSYNQSILEIKDNYRLEKEKQQKLIEKQYLKQLEQKNKINNLKAIILLGGTLFILVIVWFYIKHLRAQHKHEKKIIRKTKELELKKAEEMLDFRNKELAASALQLIEKDKFLIDLKEKIETNKKNLEVNQINRILKTISINNNKNWELFKLRFIDVNKEFYTKLLEKYPNLSQGDQKICALIKLNFSSKDMANLLGISVESVHTSRHRIRKKINLPRNINLEDFINAL